MERLVECVPNFSEGRRPAVIDALVERLSEAPGVQLLDRTSDPDHNRSVLTLAGRPESVSAAMEALVEEALARIDMERHSGQHPRIGAVDVIPFVPLGEMAMDECVGLARDFGRRIAERFELPVYLYAQAAQRAERVILADIRRPQYEGLKELIGMAEHRPDFGPPRLHPTGGAVAVGARPFLIAYNINLESEDVELAKQIAKAVRERSGGLPRVQALGLYLDDLRCAQVSMNLLDHRVTPIWRVWQEVGARAAEAGVEVRESELIGLCPLAALLEVADYAGVPAADDETRIRAAAEWARIRDFEPTMALELRLATFAGER
ncbi:MAG TPA: glutamate formimidoyltransferase [Candidatus Limnocylindria bacterium]|nr:glutamate formimidoyltransferase [Candidatus Limnocylindria bacterium]